MAVVERLVRQRLETRACAYWIAGHRHRGAVVHATTVFAGSNGGVRPLGAHTRLRASAARVAYERGCCTACA